MGAYGPLIAVLMVLAGSVGSFFYGIDMGEDRCIARGTRDEQIRQRTIEDTQKGTANALAQLEVKHTTINAAVEREIRTRVVYADCKHPPELVRSINAALSGRGAEPAGDRQLPARAAAPP